MAEEYRVATPEAIDLTYELAGLGSRVLAGALDFLIMIFLFLVVSLASQAVLFVDPTLGIIFLLTTIFAVFWGYYVLAETIWHGQSPGKEAVGIRVIKKSGLPIGFRESALRNLVRIVDFLPTFYGIGVVVMFASRQPRRIGDYVAGTIVVREQPSVRLAEIARHRLTWPIAGERQWNLDALSLQDDYAIHLAVDKGISRRRDQKAVARLAREIAAKIGGPAHGPSAYEFLDRVISLRRTAAAEDAEPSASSHVVAPAVALECGWNVRAMTAEDTRLLQEFITRAPNLSSDARSRLAGRLSEAIAARIGAQDPGSPEEFLMRIQRMMESEGVS